MDKPSRILLAEDDDLVQPALAQALRRNGCEVSVAGDGRLALEMMVEQGPFDAIVTDINMPRLSGIGLLKAISERNPDVPVIVLTGAPTLQSAIEAVEYGAFRYLQKPVATDELRAVVTRAVNLSRLLRLKSEALKLSGLPGGRLGSAELLAASLDRAMGDLHMVFQPIVGISDRRPFAYEALMRSTEPSLPHPGAVLYAAERLGRGHELGRHVRRLCAQSLETHAEFSGNLFVNLHPNDLDDDALFEPTAPLTAYADRVVLEVTERATLEGVTDVKTRLARLRDLGFRVAVDDLGAGYAGLTSFASLQPEFVKLDMSLIRGIDRDATRRRIVDSLASVCRDLQVQVVAEGIETPEERDAVVETGVDFVQGYLFARPSPPFCSVQWGT